MNELHNKHFIEDVAIEMGTDTSYVEKDWFAVKLLKHILEYQLDFDGGFIFTGGTSLSKGYGLIDRFSEDLDFLVWDKSETNKRSRSNFKSAFVEYVEGLSGYSIDKQSLEAFNNNSSFKFLVSYPRLFQSSPLRDGLKIEIKFSKPFLPLNMRPIKSFVSEYRNIPAETSALCVSPVEIAGDKLSALTWRILSCERASKEYKPQIFRHLHDIAWLKDIIDKSAEEFKISALRSFESDKDQGTLNVRNLSPVDRVDKAIELLTNDDGYKADYNEYVLEMSYSKDDDRISYESAIKKIKDIYKYFV